MFRSFLFLLLLSPTILLADDCPFCASLTIKVSGFKNQTGLLRILVVKDEKSFNESDPQKIDLQKIFFRSQKISGDSVNFDFPKLQSGTYAYKIFHDFNENEILDTSLLGKPLEGVAISGYETLSKGPAEFSKAKFILKPKAKVTHQKKLQYF